MISELVSNETNFISFDIQLKNSIGEVSLVKVNIVKEDKPNMYMIGIQF